MIGITAGWFPRRRRSWIRRHRSAGPGPGTRRGPSPGNRRLRPWVLGAGVLFHLGIDFFFDIGFFSATMWLAYLAFLPPDVADRVVARLDRIVDRVWGSRADNAPPAEALSGSRDPVPLAVEPPE